MNPETLIARVIASRAPAPVGSQLEMLSELERFYEEVGVVESRRPLASSGDVIHGVALRQRALPRGVDPASRNVVRNAH
jgi:hypothetical protein